MCKAIGWKNKMDFPLLQLNVHISGHHWNCSCQSRNKDKAMPVYSRLPNCGISTPDKGNLYSRPNHPPSLDFELNEPTIPYGSLIADIDLGTVPTMRSWHFLFASTRQLVLLALAKCWYVDGPFRLVQMKLTNSIFAITSWSIFEQQIRTNNDVEIWHKRLNSGTKSQQFLNLYNLIQVLHAEATNVNTQVQYISNGVALRYCRPKFNKSQEIITKSWSALIAGDILAKLLNHVWMDPLYLWVNEYFWIFVVNFSLWFFF